MHHALGVANDRIIAGDGFFVSALALDLCHDEPTVAAERQQQILALWRELPVSLQQQMGADSISKFFARRLPSDSAARTDVLSTSCAHREEAPAPDPAPSETPEQRKKKRETALRHTARQQLRGEAAHQQAEHPEHVLAAQEQLRLTRITLQGAYTVPPHAQGLLEVLWYPKFPNPTGVEMYNDGLLCIDPEMWLDTNSQDRCAWLLWAMSHQIWALNRRGYYATSSSRTWDTVAEVWSNQWMTEQWPDLLTRPMYGSLRQHFGEFRAATTSPEDLAEQRWVLHAVGFDSRANACRDYEAPGTLAEHASQLISWIPQAWLPTLMPMLIMTTKEEQLALCEQLVRRFPLSVTLPLFQTRGLWANQRTAWTSSALLRWNDAASPQLRSVIESGRLLG